MGPLQKFLALPFVKLFRGRRRGRLVRHYFATSLVLSGGGLIVSGLVELYFSYHDTRDHIALLQQEMAAALPSGSNSLFSASSGNEQLLRAETWLSKGYRRNTNLS